MTERMPALESRPTALLMDCIPSGPSPDMPSAFEPFFGGITPEEIDAGQAQMADAVAEFLAPAREDRHDLLITHNFVIAWFVREVFGAPPWRWLGVNQANCGLTIIRVRSAKPPVLVTHNDLGHLPAELRTGMPVGQPF
jgi:probable phosphoglycerate mutase